MTSQAQAEGLLDGLAGLVFLGYPLHPAGKPSVERAAHLAAVDLPMLFIHGARDALAEAAPFASLVKQVGPIGSFVEIDHADHAFHVLRRSGRTDDEALEEVLDWVAVWTQAWRITTLP